MKKEKKIMLLDNASSHVEDLDLSNVKLHFLPAEEIVVVLNKEEEEGREHYSY